MHQTTPKSLYHQDIIFKMGLEKEGLEILLTYQFISNYHRRSPH